MALGSALACSPTPPNPIGNTALPTPQDGVARLSKALASTQNLQLFLLFGQSNMEGTPEPDVEDRTRNPRIRVLGYEPGCNDREWNQWAVAVPPLHRCSAGVSPADWFAKALAEV